MQIMPAADAAKYRFNPFDVTKVWPHRDYPLMTIGRMVLNRNPENYFAEVEQAAFNPAHFVPGIGPSPDKMLQGRLFAYGDTHRYRPRRQSHAFAGQSAAPGRGRATTAVTARCASMAITGARRTTSPTASAVPNKPANRYGRRLKSRGSPETMRRCIIAEDNDFVQAGNLYRLMKETAKEKLIANIAASLSKVSREDIIERSIGHFRKADPEYGNQVAKAVAKQRVLR